MPPRNHFQTLQVDRDASDEVIEVAFRRLARIHHPDVNRSSDAVKRMQELNAAYAVLRDPVKRRAYNQALTEQSAPRYTSASYASASHASPPPPPEPYVPSIPVHCEGCGRSDSTLRLAAFPYVISLLIITMRQGDSGLYCEACRRAKMTNAKLASLVLGWWGIPFGPIYTLGVLFTDSGGKMPAEANSHYLAGLGVHFLQMGDLREAEESLKASLRFQHNANVETVLEGVQAINGRAEPADKRRRQPTQNERGNRSWFLWIFALVTIAFFAYVAMQSGASTQNGVAPTQSAPAAVSAATPTATSSPIVNGLITRNSVRLLANPDSGAERVSLLNNGTHVVIRAQQYECDWLLIEAGEEQGWVRASRTSIRYASDCDTLPLGFFRPDTGMLKNLRSDEYGVLEIENDGTEDAAIILTTLANVPVASAYVRSGVTFEIDEIPDGVYWVYVTSGLDWNGKEFLRAVSRERFEESFVYETDRKGKEIFTPGWSISIAPRLDGNAELDEVSAGTFPDIE